MSILKQITSLWAIGLLAPYLASAASSGNPGNSQDPAQEVQAALSSLALPEWPAKATELILAAKVPDRDPLALAIINYTASTHPASIDVMVGAVAAADPQDSPTVAVTATQLVPTDATGIKNAALNGAPAFAEQINRALSSASGNGSSGAPGNRPTTPPGLVGTTKPGSIRGDRPAQPPGLVYDPKPGRDPQRRRYGSP
jgi:hypothetical protein